MKYAENWSNEAECNRKTQAEVVAAWVVARLKGEPDAPTEVEKSVRTLRTDKLMCMTELTRTSV